MGGFIENGRGEGPCLGDLAAELRETGFLRELLSGFTRNGYGSTPKRELELLLLQLLFKHAPSWRTARPEAEKLAALLGVSTRCARSLVNEIAYRGEAAAEATERPAARPPARRRPQAA